MSLVSNLVWRKDFTYFEENKDRGVELKTLSLNGFQRVWRALGGYSHTHLAKVAAVAQAAAFNDKLVNCSKEAHAIMAKAADHQKLDYTFLGEYEVKHKAESLPFKVTCEGRMPRSSFCALFLKIIIPDNSPFEAIISINVMNNSEMRVDFTTSSKQTALGSLYSENRIAFSRIYTSIFAIVSKILKDSEKINIAKLGCYHNSDAVTEIANAQGFELCSHFYQTTSPRDMLNSQQKISLNSLVSPEKC